MTPDNGRESFTPLNAEDVANVVSRASRKRGRALDAVMYMEDADVIVLVSRPFALFVQREASAEFRDVPKEDMSAITLSAAGTSIELEKHDIHIEAVGFVAVALNAMRRTESGGLIIDLMQERWP
jgi:hypothetical protein